MSAIAQMLVGPAIPPTLSDGKTQRTGSAQSLLRLLRGPSVRLDRLRWYKHARPRCLKAHRHHGSSQADGLGHRSCPLHGRSPQSVRHEDRTLSTGGSSTFAASAKGRGDSLDVRAGSQCFIVFRSLEPLPSAFPYRTLGKTMVPILQVPGQGDGPWQYYVSRLAKL